MSDVAPTRNYIKNAETYYVYCVFSEYTDKNGLKKLGLTIHPVHRLRQYATGDAPGCGLDKHYNGLWKIEVRSRAELREMEAILHNYFADRRQGTSEWFRVTFEEVDAFMKMPQKFNVKQVSFDEVQLINTKYKEPMSDSEKTSYEEEDELRKEQEAMPVKKVQTLYEKFLRVFLPGKIPRRIQTELWNLFEEICKNPEHLCYRGIVQWPTGTGKTIATLMLIVITAERCKARGEIYRGLLISYRNDIFNTISGDFMKLSEFGITRYDGSNGKLSSLTFPRDKHILIMACPQSLLSEETGMTRLPPISHIHSDEVHRITGEKCFQLLKIMMVEWNTQILTGTSATPKTSCPEQHRKLAELFGEPYTILHKCDVDEAVREGWIAVPRFKIVTTPKQTKENEGAYAKAVVSAIVSTANDKKNMGLWKGGKMIMYLPNIAMTLCVEKEAKAVIPDATIYLAVGERTDKEFVSAPADGSLRILFACDRYREGSDIKGLEMTGVLTGDTISAYILIQIQGRSLRTDYVGKEGWCLIVSPCEEGEDEHDVMERISLNILGLLGDSHPLVKKDIERYVEAYFGNVVLGGALISKEETVKRIQAAYVRRLYIRQKKAAEGLTYKDLVSKVRSLDITTPSEYSEKALINELPADPSDIRGWISWYELLRATPDEKRMTLYDLQKFCTDNTILRKEDYIPRTDCPPWADLINGFLTDLPSPMPSHLESELFKSGRGGRR